ncbi:hypothetical protein niasHT_021336 [Heterodera trifolii]|uniref:Uncharacterized protein n=1 Tax=Heterodera trifolii TaxID=157864 RepID=A0ABD2K6F6_9BILA
MDAPDFYCLCGSVHVLTGAKWIGVLGTAVHTFGLFCAMLAQSMPMVLLCIITVPLYVSLLYAYQRNEPKMYIPFMVVNGMEMLLTIFYALFLLIMFLFVPQFWHDHLGLSLNDGEISEEQLDTVGGYEDRFITTILFSIVSLLLSLLAWFQLIVHRAYSYMCVDEHTLIPPQLHPTFLLTKAKLGLIDPRQLEEGQQERKRESRMA